MKNFLALFLSAVVLAPVGARAAEPLKVAASQAFYAELVSEIGGDRVEVKAVSSPRANAHFYEPRPSDVRFVAKADLAVYSGLDLEVWWAPLVEAAGRPEFLPGGERSVGLSEGIQLLEVPEPDYMPTRADGDIHLHGNPHYQMNPENSIVMAGTLLARLSELDPEGKAQYQANHDRFVGQLREKIAEWKALCAHTAGQEVIPCHKDIEYFTDFLGMRSLESLEPKPGVPPSPRHLQHLERYGREKKVRAIVGANYHSPEASSALASKIGAKVVRICQNTGEEPGTETIFGFFDLNFRRIAEALR